MKTIITTILSILLTFTLNAQRVVEKKIEINPTSTLKLDLEFADTIHIKQSSDNTLKIKATVSINDNQNNDNYELITNENGSYLTVKAKIHDMESIRIPCKKNGKSMYNYNDGKCLTMDISYVIEVPSIADLRLETISGDIIIDQAKNPMNIKTISGFIDMSIPAKSNSDIRIETVTGGVYTNHEFSKDNDDCDSNPGGTDANFKLGTGDNKIKLTTVSGDIFIRKI